MLECCRRPLAVALVLSITGWVSASPLAAPPSATFAGKVFQKDGTTPRSGVVIRLVTPQGDRDWPSTPTDGAGVFRIREVPVGTYRVLAESAEGAYLAREPVSLGAGENRPLSLTLGAPLPAPEEPGTTGGGTAPPAPSPPPAGGLPTWSKWVIAGGIALAALFVINEVTEDEEEAASPL